MKAYIDCTHCYLKQAVTCMEMVGVNEDRQYEILFKLMDYIKLLDKSNTPSDNSTEIILKTYELTGSVDPYSKAKKESNDMALKLYPKLQSIVDESDDRLYEALKIAAAGNIIDLGVSRYFDIDMSLEHALKTGFTRDNYDLFSEKLDKVDKILLLGDNSGEIVFDKILVTELNGLGKKVTYVVKEGPVLNDATMEDAVYTGMDKLAKVITNGSRYLGSSIKNVSPSFLSLLTESELIISKGQANFESLEHSDLVKGKIFFLLKIKCEGVGKIANAKFGDVVFFNV